MKFQFPKVIKSMGDVPDLYHPFYVKAEGENADGFSLSGDLAEFVGAQRSIVDKERTRAESAEKAAKAFRKAFGDDPEAATKKHKDEVSALEAKIEELSAAGGDDDKDGALLKKLEAQKAQLERNFEKERKALERERDEAKSKNDKMAKAVQKNLKKSAIIAAITEHKGKRKVLEPIVDRYVSVVEDGDDFVIKVMDEDGDVRRDYEKGGEMIGADGVARFVATLKADPDFIQNFEVESASGSGSRGSQTGGSKGSDSGKNPFAKETWNVTEQMALIKQDKAKATRLAEAVGRKI